MSKSDELSTMDAWLEEEQLKLARDYARIQNKELDTIEIERFTQGLTSAGLGAIVAGATRIAPSSISICYKDNNKAAPVALISFTSPRDATRALERLKSSKACDKWRMLMIANPIKKKY